jgi:hypothetical protein
VIVSKDLFFSVLTVAATEKLGKVCPTPSMLETSL